METFPALEAVVDAAKSGGKEWQGLLEAGVAEALCNNVLEMKAIFDHLPNMLAPDDLEKVRTQMKSPYYSALEALCFAIVNFLNHPEPESPTKPEKMLLSALRKNWSQIMKRLWQEPESTLDSGDSHIHERMTIAQIVVSTIKANPAITSVIYNPSDYTIPVVARYWKHSTSPLLDIKICAFALNLLFCPIVAEHKAYLSTHLPPPPSQFLLRIYLGVGPTATSSTARQAKALIAVFADHLWRLPESIARIEIDFFKYIFHQAAEDDGEPESLKVAMKFAPFWNSVFRLMRKMAKEPDEDDIQAAKGDVKAAKLFRSVVISYALTMIVAVLLPYPFDKSRECEQLIRIWINEGLFSALEETVESIVAMPGMTMELTRLFYVINDLIPTSSPSFRQLLSTQFPRWHIIGTILRHDLKRQRSSPGDAGKAMLESAVTKKLPPLDSNYWDHGAWQIISSLQFECFDIKKTCARRSCGNKGALKCICTILYCGEACQKKDEKDHKLVCGWVDVILDAVARNRKSGHA